MSRDGRRGRTARGRATSPWRAIAVSATLVLVALLVFAADAVRRVTSVATRSATVHLDAVRVGAEAAADAAWARIEAGVRRLATDGATVQAFRELARATRASEADPRINATVLAPQRAALAAHLERWYAPLGDRRVPLDDGGGLPATRRARWLQAQYVAGVGLAADGAYAEAHARWHARLAAAAAEYGLADLLLVRASDGVVVYDVAKTPVFQTSLLDGAFAGSHLGALFRRLPDAPAAGALLRADFEPFVPARDQPLAFLAAPLIANGDVVGTLVAAVDSRPLDDAVSAGGRWEALGLAADGDVALIGADGSPRTTPRRVGAGAPAASPLPPAAALVGVSAGPLRYVDPAGRAVLASVGAPGFDELGWRTVAVREESGALRDATVARRALFPDALLMALLLIAAIAALTWWAAWPPRRFGERPDGSAPRVPAAAAALCTAAEELRGDADRTIEALGVAGEVARETAQQVQEARHLANAVREGGRAAAQVARDGHAVAERAVAALGDGAQAAAALVDELSVLAVNAALQSATGAPAPLAESARVAVERAERVGAELDAMLAAARAGGDRSALAAAGRDVAALAGALECAALALGDLDAHLRTGIDDPVAAVLQAAADSGRRLRRTAELVAGEAARAASGATDASGT